MRGGSGAGEIRFEAGERIWTESSYKYRPEMVLDMGRRAGFGDAEQWIDESTHFALTRFSV